MNLMRISVTADVHLRTKAEHHERYNALENIFEQTITEGIENLLVAGDLFDKVLQDYSEFEELCRKFSNLQVHIIPGNHDPSISGKMLRTMSPGISISKTNFSWLMTATP